MPKTKRLPKRTPAEVQEWFPWHRQSLLANADTCMLATKWRLEVAEAYPLAARMDRVWDSAEAARGILAHRYAAEVLRTLWRNGHTTIPVAEALEILYEVCAQREVPDEDVVYLPARERRYLRMFAILLAYDTKARQLRPWSMDRLLAIEERRWMSVTYTDPAGNEVKRTVTGQPDATLRDTRPGGLIVIDFKSTPKAPPKAPERKRDDAGNFPGDDVPGNVSYEGFFQQKVYGPLELVNRPDIDRVTLREVYPMDRDGLQVRTATIYRQDLEHHMRELGNLVGLLDRAIAGGSSSGLWKPQPGKHCSYCPRAGSCPIPREERDEGGIDSMQVAERWAGQMVTAQELYQHRHAALKAWHEQTGLPIPVRAAKGRYELRHERGTRSFGMHVPEDSDRGPEDPNLAATFKAAAERKRAA